MNCSTGRWIVTVTAAAMLALPVAAVAQTPPTTQPPTTAQPPTQQPPSTPPADQHAVHQQSGTPQDHLRAAKAALDDVQTASLSARAKTQVNELKRRLNTLERSVSANDQASATGQASRSTSATAGTRGKANWGTEVAAMDKILSSLLSGESAATGTAGTTATTGKASDKASAAVTLDDASRTKLTEFRTHITAFARAMAAGPAPGDTPEPSSTPKTEPPTSATPPPTSATPPPTGTTQPPADQPTGTAGAAQVDAEAAKRHLTEARNTLSAITQLPAAAQLSGEARTHVAELISNFNELITTKENWREAYAKVSANLTALLGPDPGKTAASGTAGAVGTSGTATVTIDPAIREKLVVMRGQLAEFERASGGGASAPASTSEPTPATPPATTPPATTPPETAPPATAPPAAATGTAAAPSDASQADWMRHITAIETILKSQDESGGVTLDKAKVEMLRTHLAELRKLLEKK